MIKVTCDACGKSFTAKDELAHRKTRCPGCQAPLVIGAAPSPAGPRAAPAPAASRAAAQAPRADEDVAQPPVVAPGAGRRRRASSSSRLQRGRSGGGRNYTGITAGALVVAVAFAVGAYFVSQKSETNPFALAVEAQSKGRVDEAVTWFEQVEPTHPAYSQAQDHLRDLRAQQQAIASHTDSRAANALYDLIQRIESDYVFRGGEGPSVPTYAPNARYMLKRSREFLDTYPDDPRRKEIEQLMWRYSEVASLDVPPTEEDVLAEIRFRSPPSRQWNLAAMEAVIDEFARAHPTQGQVIQSLYEHLAEKNEEFWTKTRLALDKGLQTANWRMVGDDVATYLKCYEGTRIVKPHPEALELAEQAAREGS